MKYTSLIVIAALSLIAFSGCKPADPGVSEDASIDKDQQANVEGQICQSGKHLKDDSSSMTGTLMNMTFGMNKVLLFTRPGASGSCAFTADQTANGTDPVTHDPTKIVMSLGGSTCFKNGSFWRIEAQSVQQSATEVSFRIQSFLDGGEAQIEATPNVSPGLLHSRLGLRVQTCQ